jgi:Ca-activated chloride channel family protein
MGSGEAVQEIVAGRLQPHVFSPASGAYISLLNQRWQSVPGHLRPLCGAGEPLLLSPVVIAIWKPMAEALGFPGKALGWKDLIQVSTSAKGWADLGHPEWGPFRLGHTHPEFSTSGLLAVLAEAYAGAGKLRGLTSADVGADATQRFIASVEGTVVHYGKSTGFFSDKMLERGPSYVSAAVLYENLVVESYSRPAQPAFPLVSIYPVEGTFWADHPYAVLDEAWVSPNEREAAQQFLAFLKARPQQERALALGFRPADATIAIGAPIDAAHGADPKQPQTLLEVPSVETLDALLEVFRRVKKPAEVVLVFDKSGSMQGPPLEQAKAGAKAFLNALSDRDRVSLLFFDTQVYPPIGPFELKDHRKDLLARIDTVIAAGGTALYDATLKARELLVADAASRKGAITAVVVMTDGRDESSQAPLERVEAAVKVEGGEAAPVRVFTIAYGKGAEAAVLARIAEAGSGSSASGDVSSIIQVYQDMASFF